MAPVLSQKAVDLAEAGEWIALQKLLTANKANAKERDPFGMLPLHWACTEMNVPLNIIQLLLEAFPEAVCLKNNSHMLPLHIAVRTGLPTDHVKLLVDSYPEATLEENIEGKTPIDVASECIGQKMNLGVLIHARKSVYVRQSEIDHLVDTNKKKEKSTSTEHIGENNQEEDQDILKKEYQLENRCEKCKHETVDRLPHLIQQLKELNENMNMNGKLYDTLLDRGSCISSHWSVDSKGSGEYQVIWMEGQLGISLTQPREGPGAQVKRFTEIKGNAEGINHVKVGHVLLRVNGIHVTSLPFSNIVDILKTAKKPTSLVFTSDTEFLSARRSRFLIQASARSSSATTISSGSLFCSEQSSGSITSSSSPQKLSDVDQWMDTQDSIHSKLLLLLTETLGLCESLKLELCDKKQSEFQNQLCRTNLETMK